MPGCVLRITALEAIIAAEHSTSKDESRFVYPIGEADGDDFKGQIVAAASFLNEHSNALAAARAEKKLISAELDFGVWNGAPEILAQSYTFPPSFVAVAVAAGVALTVTTYLASDD